MSPIPTAIFFLPGKSRLRRAVLCLAIPYARTVPAMADETSGEPVELDTVVVEGKAAIKIGPWEGSLLTKEQIAGNVQSISSQDIKESFATSLGDLMNTHLQSVNVNDYQGNPFQMDVTYRGFSASPQLGTPQGLSVFLDGIRVNEPFGDVVNWDLIPMNALSGMDMFPGSNPLFGLNTLGGALALRTKNGFDDPGVDARFQGGSWDRKKGEVSAGWNNGTVGGFLAFTGFDEEGWRQNSPSQVNQGFGRLDWRGERFALKASLLMVGNQLLGNGLLPTELYRQDPTAVFSSPDQTENNLQQYSLGGEWFFTDHLSLTGQIYRRDSSRTAVAGDIYEDFQDMENGWANPLKANGTRNGQPVCRYQDANKDGVPDYGLDKDSDGEIDSGSLNTTLQSGDADYLVLMPPMNGNCSRINYVPVSDDSGPRNGAAGDVKHQPAAPGLSPTGWVDGTPIGVLSRTGIQQMTDGASLQLNWDSEQHKFMLGGSVDAADTDFNTSQRLGLMDASHRVYNDPSQIDPIFTAGREDISNNSFTGKSTTFSGYFSETFSPKDNLHLSLAGRFNHTRVKNRMRARTRAGFEDLHDILDLNTYRPTVIVCPGTDMASCPTQANYNLRANWDNDVWLSQDPYYGLGKYSETPTSEQFDYTSFNPSVGISYLPFKNQNLPAVVKDTNTFFNWSQGTRTPSSVELGCAYDGTLVPQTPGDPNSPKIPKSLASIGGACTLPTALSGDPYLPQIFANSYEFGLRGNLFGDWEWNTSVYRTDLQNDIYLVGVTSTRSFFDTIGDTRRQGVELGFSGKAGIVDFRVNYGYTEATFQSKLFMVSPYNSSAAVTTPLEPRYGSDGRPLEAVADMIEINPGDRMPGIPLHNLNLTVNLHLTQQWELGGTMVAHSSSFVRGNENNGHTQGAYEYVERLNATGTAMELVRLRQFTDSGSVPGYVIFNLKTRYELGKGLSVFGLMNNVFDQQYASAGRLGINPFSPSDQGTVGASGWNYNSNDWLNTTLIGPGAPRAYWVGVEYHFGL
jgi:iron complex outermembrane receptor protein